MPDAEACSFCLMGACYHGSARYGASYQTFNDPTHNTKGAQLIFTTHNTNLLDTSLFRRDQIWFTEKDPSNGSTDLYSLAEFKPRKSEDIEQGYLLGRYGAIPFFGKEFLF